MSDEKKLKFSGKGFSKEEFTPEERAEQRERSYHFDTHFLSVEDFLKATGLLGLSKVMRGMPSVVKGIAWVSAVGAALTFLKAKGLL